MFLLPGDASATASKSYWRHENRAYFLFRGEGKDQLQNTVKQERGTFPDTIRYINTDKATK